MQINLTNEFASTNSITDQGEVRTRRQTESGPTSSQVTPPFVTAPPGPKPAIQAHLRTLEQSLQDFNISLKFSYDEETQTILVKLVDQASGELLQQYPSPEKLRLTASLSKLQGQLIDRRV